MKIRVLGILLCTFSLIQPVVSAMEIIVAVGACCLCCAKVMPEILKFGASIMHERDVKAMKEKLKLLQDKSPKAFKGLVKKCLDPKIKLEEDVRIVLLAFGFIKPTGVLADCVQDAVFALVVTEDGEILSKIIDPRTSTASAHEPLVGSEPTSVATGGSRKMLKKPHEIDSIKLKVLSRKEALRSGYICESTQEDLRSFHTCRSNGTNSVPESQRGNPFEECELYDIEGHDREE